MNKQLKTQLQSWIASVAPKSLRVRHLYSAFEEIAKTQYLDTKRLSLVRDERLEKLLQIARGLPGYSGRHGNLSAFPIIDKAQMLGHEDDFKNPAFRNPLKASTSGSSGQPFMFCRSKQDSKVEFMYVLRAFHRYGYKPGDLVAGLRSYIPSGPEAKLTLDDRYHDLFWLSAYHMSDDVLKTYVEQLNRLKCRSMITYPSSAFLLADYIQRTGNSLPHLAAMLTSSEKLLPQWKARIEKAMPSTELIDRYGNAEFTASWTSCSICKGYHIHEDYSYTELIPTEAGRHRIVGTGFLNSAFPMVRYDTGDLFKLDEVIESQCNLGSKVFRGEIEGRSTDFVFSEDKYLPGVNFYTLFYHYSDVIKQFQLVQDDPDRIEVRLVCPDPVAFEARRSELEAELRQRVGSRLKLDYVLVSEIPRDAKTGKIKNIVSKYAVKQLGLT